MYDGRKRIDRLAVKQNIHLHEVGFAIAAELVIERSIAAGCRFQAVEVIKDNLTERQRIVNHYTRIVKIGHVVIFAAFFLAQLHNRADIILRHDNRCVYVRLLNMVYNRRVREERRIVDHLHIAVGAEHLINNVRCCRNQAQVIFTLQALLDNVHMQKSQEAAAEAKAQRCRGLRLEYERSIVQLQLF